MYRVDMSTRYNAEAMLELAILGLLKERPMHGYDLRKRLRSGAGLLASLSYGSLYPALARLQRAGAVREIEPAEESGAEFAPAEVIPLTGSLAGEKAAFRARLAARAASTRAAARSAAGTRGRKVYELTPIGEAMFTSLLTEDAGRPADDRSFALRWSFARYLPAEGRLHLLERQRRRLEDRIAAAKRATSATIGSGSAIGTGGLDRYERQIADHAIDSLNRDLAWIESLIAMERAAAGSTAPNTGTDVS
jgi:DNA-binding PadR family transcriptional regulator